jgi:hypothetical protein
LETFPTGEIYDVLAPGMRAQQVVDCRNVYSGPTICRNALRRKYMRAPNAATCSDPPKVPRLGGTPRETSRYGCFGTNLAHADLLPR